MVIRISKKERNSLLLGVLAFIVGPIAGVYAIFYAVRCLRDPCSSRVWPHLMSICLAVFGVVVFCVTAILFGSVAIKAGL